MQPNTYDIKVYTKQIQKDKHSRDGRKYHKPGKGGKLRHSNIHHRNTIGGWRDDVTKEQIKEQ